CLLVRDTARATERIIARNDLGRRDARELSTRARAASWWQGAARSPVTPYRLGRSRTPVRSNQEFRILAWQCSLAAIGIHFQYSECRPRVGRPLLGHRDDGTVGVHGERIAVFAALARIVE